MFAPTTLSILASFAASASALHAGPRPTLPPGVQPIIIVEGLRPGGTTRVCGALRTLESVESRSRALHNERGVFLLSRARLAYDGAGVLASLADGEIACAESDARPAPVLVEGEEVEGVFDFRPYLVEPHEATEATAPATAP